ncbi:hypothetical protein SISSUDRAFT_635964 [Sistotremastrum suecicum HHB10207 ss-3]|uniref:Uncharacterized protein n=1 Tax=Sistotremastrum suecicum HHB10207 ss-3 TaxID=1314776 RepID=A0A166EEP7_9AGAM|nr:hypothetical protein SISSUDRAFT_635964 [Sistotremastrum suecicum HHB10207 ss-3]
MKLRIQTLRNEGLENLTKQPRTTKSIRKAGIYHMKRSQASSGTFSRLVLASWSCGVFEYSRALSSGSFASFRHLHTFQARLHMKVPCSNCLHTLRIVLHGDQHFRRSMSLSTCFSNVGLTMEEVDRTLRFSLICSLISGPAIYIGSILAGTKWASCIVTGHVDVVSTHVHFVNIALVLHRSQASGCHRLSCTT